MSILGNAKLMFCDGATQPSVIHQGEAIMVIRRVVPDHTSKDLARSRVFYGDFLGFGVGMDMGWIVNFVSPDNPGAQVIVMTEDETADVSPDLTIEVDDVDRLHRRALELGHEIVHPLTDEPWGVRRFFVRDPDGRVVNVMSHLARRSEVPPS